MGFRALGLGVSLRPSHWIHPGPIVQGDRTTSPARPDILCVEAGEGTGCTSQRIRVQRFIRRAPAIGHICLLIVTDKRWASSGLFRCRSSALRLSSVHVLRFFRISSPSN